MADVLLATGALIVIVALVGYIGAGVGGPLN